MFFQINPNENQFRGKTCFSEEFVVLLYQIVQQGCELIWTFVYCIQELNPVPDRF
jgi:hypothetical protein